MDKSRTIRHRVNVMDDIPVRNIAITVAKIGGDYRCDVEKDGHVYGEDMTVAEVYDLIAGMTISARAKAAIRKKIVDCLW